MTRATITVFYDNDRWLISVVNQCVQELKEGTEKGRIERLGVVASFEQEILVDYEKIETRVENGVMYIKSKL